MTDRELAKCVRCNFYSVFRLNGKKANEKDDL